MSTIIDNEAFLTSNLKGLLHEKLWLLEERLQKKRYATRYKSFTDAQARILSTLRGESLTISEVARRLGISRQAVHKIVSTLVKAKFLQLESLPGNSRDKCITFTPEGVALKQKAAEVLEELEQEIKIRLGAKDFNLLKSLLKKAW